jgi:hypothetical protein
LLPDINELSWRNHVDPLHALYVRAIMPLTFAMNGISVCHAYAIDLLHLDLLLRLAF